jgi:hypothetical protein
VTDDARTLRALRRLDESLSKAVAESSLAYDFCPNSYTFGLRSGSARTGRSARSLSGGEAVT